MNENDEGAMREPREISRLFDYRAATRGRGEEGTVVTVRGDTAEVLLRRSRLCEGCGSCCVAVDAETMLAEADNVAGAKEGDRVQVSLPASRSIKAAYILYGIPLLAFLFGLGAGALLGWALFGGGLSAPFALLLGFVFLAAAFFALSRVYAPGSRASSRYRLVITKILR